MVMMAAETQTERRSSSCSSFAGSQFSVASARWMRAPKSDISSLSSSSSSSSSSFHFSDHDDSDVPFLNGSTRSEEGVGADPPIDWEKLALHFRGNRQEETVEDLRKKKIETCQRLIVNFNQIARKLREDRLASLSQRQSQRDELNTSQEDGEQTLLIEPDSGDRTLLIEDSEAEETQEDSGHQERKRLRWGRRSLVFHRLRTMPMSKRKTTRGT